MTERKDKPATAQCGIKALLQGLHFDDVAAFFEKNGLPGLKKVELQGLWGRCICVCKQSAEAEDLFFKTLSKVAGLEPEKWRPVGKRKAWFKKIAKNAFLDQVKIAKRRDIREEAYAERQIVKKAKRGRVGKPMYAYAEADASNGSPKLLAIRRVLKEECTPKMRRAVELRLRKVPYEEIAAELGVFEAVARQMCRDVKRMVKKAVNIEKDSVA